MQVCTIKIVEGKTLKHLCVLYTYFCIRDHNAIEILHFLYKHRTVDFLNACEKPINTRFGVLHSRYLFERTMRVTAKAA